MQLSNLKTPCFILDSDKLVSNVLEFKRALNSRFSNHCIGYSIKTNSLPYMLHMLNELGCYAEVVSYTEYALALQVGFEKSHIVYNGPAKDKETFLDAIKNGAYVNIDTKREIEWLNDLNKQHSYKVGIRVNLNLGKISPEDAKEGESDSRFGFSFENGELEEAINKIQLCKNVKLGGLHLHRTSLTRSLNVYRNICKYAIRIINSLGLELDYIDVGGGYFGDKPNAPTYKEYVDTIYSSLLEEGIDVSKMKVIVEPGNAIVASPFSFLSEIIDTKKIGDSQIIVTDGSRNDVDPFFPKKDYFKSFIRKQEEKVFIDSQMVVGCSCLEYDKLFTLQNQPLLNVGDRILYQNVGAYTMTLSPLFIRFFPRVYLKTLNGYEIIREEWTVNDLKQ